MHSIDPGLMINNVAGLAQSARDLGVPVVLTTVGEVCLAQWVLGALKDGFDVYFVSDCSGGITPEAHDDAKARPVIS